MLRHSFRLVCVFLALTLAASVISFGQTAHPTKSAERLAIERGQEAIKNRDTARARAEFEKAVRLAPNDAEAQSALGWVLAQQGELEAAVTHLKAAIKVTPAFVDARLTLAGVLGQQGKAAEAEQEVRAAVKVAPGNAEAHRMLGRMLSQRGSQDEALAEMRRAVELAPERADLHDDLGSVLAQQNQFAAAEAAFKDAICASQANLEPAHFHLGCDLLASETIR